MTPRVFEEKLHCPTIMAADCAEGGWTQALPSAEANHLASARPQVRSWMDDIRDYLKDKFLPEDDGTTEWIA